MVTKRKWAKKTKRRGRNKFMPRGLAYKKHNATDTKTFYFKSSGISTSSLTSGGYYSSFKSQELYSDPANHPQFTNFRQCYDEYKVLGMRIRFFPCAVGLEPRYTTTGMPSILNRGNLIVWNDQQYDNNVQVPTSIKDVINDSSARMLNARRSFTRTIARPKGFPGWGKNNSVPPPPPPPGIPPTYPEADPWNGCINILVDGSTPSTLGNPAVQLYYWTITYKVIFRGRQT